MTDTTNVTIIKPRRIWNFIDFKELAEYRDLFAFLIWRDIKILYAQTILGFAWAILNPLLQIIIFTLVFGRIAKVSTESIPYVLFCSVAVVPWTYINQALTQSSQSLVVGQQILSKVYFPRVLFPLTPVFATLMDFMISLLILLVVMGYYRVAPTWNLLLLPVFILMMVSIPAGLGMLLSSMAARFRDVKFATRFAITLLMYSAPIVYSAASLPKTSRLIYSLNPLVGVIEGFRACLLGTDIPWLYILPGMGTTVLLLLVSSLYFRRTEWIFADVV
ncbi:MAG: phosphate ABC transporter permease [Planctomycetes bacterium GWF2_41_51]|nr:MAG: phosphate ABC transporter permease [Planctomycetes bacterium GWF2_41_51]HBG28288.1 phosphate ABC transporter permease [Phycisphaerales bacterium]